MGIYDRDYIRNRPSGGDGDIGPSAVLARTGHPVTWILVGLNVLFWMAYHMMPAPAQAAFFLPHFMVSGERVLGDLYLHTLIASSFFHIEFGHLLLNMLLLWFLGRTLEEEPTVGSRNLMWLYLLAAFTGSLAFAVLSPGAALGASDAVVALAAVAALAVPGRRVSLFGLVSMPMVVFAVLVLVLTLLPIGTSAGEGVAHMAHLGGIVAGVLYWTLDLRLFRADGTARWRWLRWMDRGRTRSRAGGGTGAGAGNGGAAASDAGQAAERERMEALLAKISEQGIDALTDEEREFLNRASRRYKGGR